MAVPSVATRSSGSLQSAGVAVLLGSLLAAFLLVVTSNDPSSASGFAEGQQQQAMARLSIKASDAAIAIAHLNLASVPAQTNAAVPKKISSEVAQAMAEAKLSKPPSIPGMTNPPVPAKLLKELKQAEAEVAVETKVTAAHAKKKTGK